LDKFRENLAVMSLAKLNFQPKSINNRSRGAVSVVAAGVALVAVSVEMDSERSRQRALVVFMVTENKVGPAKTQFLTQPRFQ